MPQPLSFEIDTGTFGPGIRNQVLTYDGLVFDLDASTGRVGLTDVPLDAGVVAGRFGAGVQASVDLRAGPIFGLDLRPGEIDLDYAISLDEAISDTVVGIGRPFIDTGDFAVTRGALSSSGPDLDGSGVFVDAVGEIDADVIVDLSASGKVRVPFAPDPTFDGSTSFDLLPFGEVGGQARILDLRGSQLDRTVDLGFGKVAIDLPSGIAAADTRLRADADGLPNLAARGQTGEVVEASLNVPAAVASLFGISPKLFRGSDSFEADLGRLDLNAGYGYTTVAADVGGGLKLFQEVDFDPTEVLVAMTTSFGETVRGRLGDRIEFDAPAGHGSFDVTAEYRLVGDVTTTTGVIPTGFLDVEVGAGRISTSVEIDVPDWLPFVPDEVGIDTGSRSFGPLIDERLNLGAGSEVELLTRTHRVESDPIETSHTVQYERFFEGTAGADAFTLTPSQVSVRGLAGDDVIKGQRPRQHPLRRQR